MTKFTVCSESFRFAECIRVVTTLRLSRVRVDDRRSGRRGVTFPLLVHSESLAVENQSQDLHVPPDQGSPTWYLNSRGP